MPADRVTIVGMRPVHVGMLVFVLALPIALAAQEFDVTSIKKNTAPG